LWEVKHGFSFVFHLLSSNTLMLENQCNLPQFLKQLSASMGNALGYRAIHKNISLWSDWRNFDGDTCFTGVLDL
jgi:hypothetical protein